MKKRILFCAGLLALLLTACGGPTYLTKAETETATDYKAAVAVDGYDGDVFQAGTYEFSPKIYDENKLQSVYDIYVSDTNTDDVSTLPSTALKGSVGGSSQESLTLNLKSGHYIYVVYLAGTDDKGSNAVLIQLQK